MLVILKKPNEVGCNVDKTYFISLLKTNQAFAIFAKHSFFSIAKRSNMYIQTCRTLTDRKESVIINLKMSVKKDVRFLIVL